jgi:hypothetical protein
MKPSRTKPDKRLNYTTAHFKVTHELRRGLADISLMAAMGQKRTSHRRPKSNFVRYGPKADKTERNWIVGFVPIATNAPQQTASLFDHLVSERD